MTETETKRENIQWIAKCWQKTPVLFYRFIGDWTSENQNLVEKEMNKLKLGIRFEKASLDKKNGYAELRITWNTQKPSWSTVGSDADLIAADQPTINIGKQNFIRHLLDHALGFADESIYPKCCSNEVKECVSNELFHAVYPKITSEDRSKKQQESLVKYFSTQTDQVVQFLEKGSTIRPCQLPQDKPSGSTFYFGSYTNESIIIDGSQSQHLNTNPRTYLYLFKEDH